MNNVRQLWIASHAIRLGSQWTAKDGTHTLRVTAFRGSIQSATIVGRRSDGRLFARPLRDLVKGYSPNGEAHL